MPRPKVYVTLENALAIYQYFANALHNKRLFPPASKAHHHAAQAFAQLPNLTDSSSISKVEVAELQNWVDSHVPLEKWKRCLATLRQIRSTQKLELRSLKINEATYARLKSYADEQGLSIQDTVGQVLQRAQKIKTPLDDTVASAYDAVPIMLPAAVYEKIQQLGLSENKPAETIQHLIEAEEERLGLLTSSEGDAKPSPYLTAKTKTITEICYKAFQPIGLKNELDEIGEAIEMLYKTLLKKRLLFTKVDSALITESRSIEVAYIHYYYFASVLAKCVTRWFGTVKIYLYYSFLPETKLFFVGMPHNVEASLVVFEFLYRLFCKLKMDHKKLLGKRFKKSNLEKYSHEYVYQLALQLEYVQAWIGQEGDSAKLWRYVEKRYPFALR